MPSELQNSQNCTLESPSVVGSRTHDRNLLFVGIWPFWGHFCYKKNYFINKSAIRIAKFSKLHPWEPFCRFGHVCVRPKSQVPLNDGILTFWGHFYFKKILRFRVTSALRFAKFSKLHSWEPFCRFSKNAPNHPSLEPLRQVFPTTYGFEILICCSRGQVLMEKQPDQAVLS